MKEYTLDETWNNCLAMWKHISRRMLKPGRDVNDEKRRWCKIHGFENLFLGCFFCDYTDRKRRLGRPLCSNCPGYLVDKSFNCMNLHYHYILKPRAFYQELKRLNKIRLERKEK